MKFTVKKLKRIQQFLNALLEQTTALQFRKREVKRLKYSLKEGYSLSVREEDWLKTLLAMYKIDVKPDEVRYPNLKILKDKIKNSSLSESVKNEAVSYLNEIKKFSNSDRNKIIFIDSEFASIIFDWKKTPQGHEFWKEISDTLRREKKMSSKREELRKILNDHIDSALATGGGFGINKKGESQESQSEGYAVSITDDKLTALNRIALIEDRIDWLLSEGEGEDCKRICGLWISDGAVYFDKGFNLEFLRNARFIAKLFNQKAVWSYYDKEEVYIN